MAKYNLNIFLIAIVGLAVIVSGCVNSNEGTQKTQGVVPTIIQTPVLTSTSNVNQRSSMSFTEFYDAYMSNDLTTLQKENLYVNKIFMWNGQVTEVTQDSVTIKPFFGDGYSNKTVGDLYKADSKITLFVTDDQKSKLISLSKGDIITFEGTTTKESVKKYLTLSVTMYNGRIIG